MGETRKNCEKVQKLWKCTQIIATGTYIEKSEKKNRNLLRFVLRWINGAKLRVHVVRQCRWSFGCLRQFPSSPASALEIGGIQPVHQVLTAVPNEAKC